MNDIKSKISSREKDWDFYKKFTNPYEYIHTIVPQKKKSVSRHKPISRSYFKMLEMIAEFRLDQPAIPESTSFQKTYCSPVFFADKMRTFHLAEGPGGFIEAICNKRDNQADEYYGMTIILDENDDNVPAWHKTGHFLSQHSNVNLEYGIDGTGNLLHIDNFEYCVKKYGSSMDLITADGGFDFSKDFNRQEISITNLIWGQVCYAICLQKIGGNFVLKIFDIFYRPTVDILYILSAFYEEVNICKLKTSRVGNSEKYVVCKKFRFSSCFAFYPKIYESFLKIKSDYAISDLLHSPMKPPSVVSLQLRLQNHSMPSLSAALLPRSGIVQLVPSNSTFLLPTITIGDREFCSDNKQIFDSIIDNRIFENAKNKEELILRLLNFDIPRHFTKTIEEINAIFGQQQIDNIHYTISLIDKQPKQDKLDQLVKQNIAKCINWCIEHSVIYNNLVATNMFGVKPNDTHSSFNGKLIRPASSDTIGISEGIR